MTYIKLPNGSLRDVDELCRFYACDPRLEPMVRHIGLNVSTAPAASVRFWVIMAAELLAVADCVDPLRIERACKDGIEKLQARLSNGTKLDNNGDVSS